MSSIHGQNLKKITSKIHLSLIRGHQLKKGEMRDFSLERTCFKYAASFKDFFLLGIKKNAYWTFNK